jgi:predicted metal-binding transcription factor (methanogenesis marker protein 9)
MHPLRVNDLLRTQNSDLQDALNIKKKHKTKHTSLNLQQRLKYHSGVVFWSPGKPCEARAREATKQDEAQREKLQKKEAREEKAAASFLKNQKAEEAKVERQQLKEQREMAKKAKAEELAAARALKKQQQDAATSQKSHNTLKKGK